MNAHDPFVDLIDAVCQQVAAGKLAARQIKSWVEHVDISEIEFRLLWLLRHTGDSQTDGQSTLARRLGVSQAQVSSCLDRLRTRDLARVAEARSDRRRQCWQLTARGRKLLAELIRHIGLLLPTLVKEAA